MGEELETAGHDQMTLFVTRKRLHMQHQPDLLDKWIARDIQLSPGGDYVDNTAGETPSTEEREECERCLERFHKRCKLGGKADRLVRIVDRCMPRIAEENKIFVMRFPDKVDKMLRRARGGPQKDPGKEKAATRGSSHTAKGRATRGAQTCQYGGGCRAVQ